MYKTDQVLRSWNVFVDIRNRNLRLLHHSSTIAMRPILGFKLWCLDLESVFPWAGKTRFSNLLPPKSWILSPGKNLIIP